MGTQHLPNALIKGNGKLTNNITQEIQNNYDNNITDEFLNQ